MSDSSSSLPSPKIRFRELDADFLQKQARIWLEAVVGERYDQDLSLSSLLSDGQILRKVSSKLCELIQKHPDRDLSSTGSFLLEPSPQGKHSGRYLPYSNIDTFLKICQNLGLTGVDLFSPSDVVEEKDIRRVCLCIRALSQKARARHVKVPNFDDVTHSVAVLPADTSGLSKVFANYANSANSGLLTAETLENKENPEKAFWTPLLQRKWADRKSTKGLPDNPITNGHQEVGFAVDRGRKLSGKPFRTTNSMDLVPSSFQEEGSKNTNNTKWNTVEEDSSVPYNRFRCKVSRALFDDNGEFQKDSNSVKKHSTITEEEHSLAPYNGFGRKVSRALFDNNGEFQIDSDSAKKHSTITESSQAFCAMASSNGDESDEITCPSTDSSASPSNNTEHDHLDEQQSTHEDSSLEGDKQRPRRRPPWKPILTITMAVLGLVFMKVKSGRRVTHPPPGRHGDCTCNTQNGDSSPSSDHEAQKTYHSPSEAAQP